MYVTKQVALVSHFASRASHFSLAVAAAYKVLCTIPLKYAKFDDDDVNDYNCYREIYREEKKIPAMRTGVIPTEGPDTRFEPSTSY